MGFFDRLREVIGLGPASGTFEASGLETVRLTFSFAANRFVGPTELVVLKTTINNVQSVRTVEGFNQGPALLSVTVLTDIGSHLAVFGHDNIIALRQRIQAAIEGAPLFPKLIAPGLRGPQAGVLSDAELKISNVDIVRDAAVGAAKDAGEVAGKAAQGVADAVKSIGFPVVAGLILAVVGGILIYAYQKGSK
jgi:hypothetical protein